MIYILLIVFTLLLLFYLFFILRIKIGLSKLKECNSTFDETSYISIIIPFRNESAAILENLESLIQQNYPVDKFEVIYVNDHSTDDTLVKLKNAISTENIFIYSLDESGLSKAHKKRAIEFGIKKAKRDIIFFTDADTVCNPEWIKSMMSCFDEKTAFVAGPVQFTNSKTFFEEIQQLEFAGLILSSAGLIGANKPMICSSANLAFRKKVFIEVGGYDDLMNLSSGDDELLMQKIACDTEYKIRFCFDKTALVSTTANKSLTEFAQQRKRWASKGLFYKNKFITIQLILIFLFYLGLIIQLVMGVTINNYFIFSFVISLIIKMGVEFTVLKKGIGILLNEIKLKIFFATELIHVPYIIYSSIAGAFGKFTWKERELKR